MEMSKRAAIIVVTYNGEKYVRPLLESISLLEYPRENFKIFVIDNASMDRTVEETRNKKLETRYLNVEIVEQEENLGFAGGNNVGMRMAMSEGYDYIILLNQDMVVEKDWLRELVRVAELEYDTKDAKHPKLPLGVAQGERKCESGENAKVGVVQAMMLLEWDKEKIYSTGDRLNYLGIGYSGNYQLPIFNFQLRTNIITYAGGAAVLFKREVLEQVGLFEEMFFAYHEDSDLSWRARLAGWDIVLAEKAVCFHDYHFGHNPKTFYWTERNRLMFLWRCFELKTLLLIFPMGLLMDIGMLGYALMAGWFWQKIRAYGWFLKNFGKILKRRRKIQAERKVKDRDLKKYLVAGVEFGGLENPLLKYVANPAMRLYWLLVGRFI